MCEATQAHEAWEAWGFVTSSAFSPPVTPKLGAYNLVVGARRPPQEPRVRARLCVSADVAAAGLEERIPKDQDLQRPLPVLRSILLNPGAALFASAEEAEASIDKWHGGVSVRVQMRQVGARFRDHRKF